MIRRNLSRRLRMLELLESRLLLAGNPVAEWQFDSSSGTVLVDSIGTSNGTITGSNVFNSTATAQVAVMPVWTAASALTTQQWGTGTRNGALRLFSDTDGAGGRGRRAAVVVGKLLVQGRQYERRTIRLQRGERWSKHGNVGGDAALRTRQQHDRAERLYL